LDLSILTRHEEFYTDSGDVPADENFRSTWLPINNFQEEKERSIHGQQSTHITQISKILESRKRSFK